MDIKRHFSLWIAAAATALSASADAPAGYYDSCEGLCGAQLLKALETVISDHTQLSYSGVWDAYESTDLDANGKVWDMYSTKRWTYGSEQCGTYSRVGDCYNREHSMPKSWFNDGYPMYTDIHHLFPTDGYVNNQRGNYPFGECADGVSVSDNGSVKPLGKLGTSTFSGYSGKVFEPDDEYKGDFARAHLYMAACYNSRISTWDCDGDVFAGNSYPAFSTWSVNLLLKWHRNDPVSEKERARNDAAYGVQGNRNPFIDHPELAEHIWGDAKNVGWGSELPAQPVLVTPSNGTSIDCGTTAVDFSLNTTVTVKGTDFTEPLTISVASGAANGFAVSTNQLTAAQVNAGAKLIVTYCPQTAGNHSATLSLQSGNVSATVYLSGRAVDGIPASPATNITRESFTANWTNVLGANAVYALTVERDGSAIAGFPVNVAAADEHYDVTGLDENTTYTYYVEYGSLRSNIVEVTTHGDLPELLVEPLAPLSFTSRPGEPSAAIDIIVDAYNVTSDVCVEVDAPFEVSEDGAEWGTSLTFPTETDRFSLRLNGTEEGAYTTSVRVRAGDLLNDELMAQGTINASTGDMHEGFERELTGGYASEGIREDAATWTFVNAGVFDDSRNVHQGSRGVRFTADATGSVTMVTDIDEGFNNVGFYCRLWDNKPATVALEYSTDSGATWTEAAVVKVANEWTQHIATVNTVGATRLRLVKKTGGRIALDDIEALAPASIGAVVDEGWSVGHKGSTLTIDGTVDARVYSVDGVIVFDGHIDGSLSLSLTPGLYLVAVDGSDTVRRIVIR